MPSLSPKILIQFQNLIPKFSVNRTEAPLPPPISALYCTPKDKTDNKLHITSCIMQKENPLTRDSGMQAVYLFIHLFICLFIISIHRFLLMANLK